MIFRNTAIPDECYTVLGGTNGIQYLHSRSTVSYWVNKLYKYVKHNVYFFTRPTFINFIKDDDENIVGNLVATDNTTEIKITIKDNINSWIESRAKREEIDTILETFAANILK